MEERNTTLSLQLRTDRPVFMIQRAKIEESTQLGGEHIFGDLINRKFCLETNQTL